jgi:hypothetical protein
LFIFLAVAHGEASRVKEINNQREIYSQIALCSARPRPEQRGQRQVYNKITDF